MKTIESIQDLAPLVGQETIASDWFTVTQEHINQFAQATGDHQWIHVDVERAKAGPFKAPIAHGFLTLSLLPQFLASALTIRKSGMGVNYGLNRVRFTAPVPAGSRLRAHFKLLALDSIDKGGVQMTWEMKVECEGSEKPVCIAESLTRRYP